MGCRGVYRIPDPFRSFLPLDVLGAGGAGWNIRPLYEYAMIMGDKQYLKKHVLPLYMEMAEFYENYLTFRINEDGTLAEWMDKNYPDVYQHRHNSHLYPVFPRTELIHAVDTALLHAATAALYKRFEFDTSSTHGLIHLALQAIHLKNTHIMELNLDRFAKRKYLYSSLVSSHEPNHQIYNLDAILSFPRLLMEALVFTDAGQIELLPAWPEDYPDGNIKGMRIYGGHTLDMSWKAGKLVSFAIHAGNDDVCTVVYKDEKKQVAMKKGKTYNQVDLL